MFKKNINGFLFIVLTLILLTLSSSINTGNVYALAGEVKGGPPLTDTFTYQGYFEYAGNPANGFYDFRITIWDLDTGGIQIASCQALDGIQIQDGLFTFHLIPNTTMNEVFDGDGRWLQVEVRQTGATTWSTLPRQPITAVPYAWNLRSGADIDANHISASDDTPTGVAIYAHHLSDGYAVLGSTDGAYPAVGGNNGGTGNALYAYSEAGHAIYGYTNVTTKSAIIGFQNGYSMIDFDASYYNPAAFFGGRNGVIGFTKTSSGYGVFGYANGLSSRAIVGLNNATSGYSGYFSSPNGANGVYISSDAGTTALVVSGGTKNAAVETDQGSTLLYTEESTEVWFTDYGFGVLDAPSVTINIDPLFSQTVNLEEDYHVFLQAYGDAAIYVTNRTPNSFEVYWNEGALPVEFSYRIVARRLGFEDDRLEILDNASSVSMDAIQQNSMEGN